MILLLLKSITKVPLTSRGAGSTSGGGGGKAVALQSYATSLCTWSQLSSGLVGTVQMLCRQSKEIKSSLLFSADIDNYLSDLLNSNLHYNTIVHCDHGYSQLAW